MSSNYYREQGFKSRKRLFRRLRFLVLLLFLAVLVAVGYLGYDIFRQSRASDTASDATTPITSTITSGTQVLRTDYFQFRAPSKWRAVASETKGGHYVYRQFNSSLVEQEFVVDVDSNSNDVVALTQNTHVLPATITDAGTIELKDEVSDHCAKGVKPGSQKTPQIVTYKQVTFACVPDGVAYVVVVGAKGGTTNLALKRPSGARITIKLTYRNMTVNPNARDLMNIVRSFETR